MLNLYHIHAGYGEQVMLQGISMRISPGQTVCVTGSAHAGKTTLLRCITGLIRLREGSMDWDGQDLAGMTCAQRARFGIGYVPQGGEIFGQLSVFENLLLGLAAAERPKERVPEEILEWFPQLWNCLHQRGYDLCNERKIQLALARALVSKPKLLLLDQPTEGLPAQSARDIEACLMMLKKETNMAVLLIEQHKELIRHVADEVYTLQHGILQLDKAYAAVGGQAALRKYAI